MELPNTLRSHMEQLISLHQNLLSDSIYAILAPENMTMGKIFTETCEITQQDIINYYINFEHNESITAYPDTINILYANTYLIKYKFLNPNNLNSSILISPQEPNSVHIIRLIGLRKIPSYRLELDIQIENKYLGDILMELTTLITGTDIVANLCPTDYCSVCGKNLLTRGIGKIQTCDRENCVLEAKQLVMDNYITDLYKKDPVVCEFLIKIFVTGASHPKEDKIFKPVPVFKNVSSFSQFKQLLDECVRNGLMDLEYIIQSKTDIELFKTIGSKAYGMIMSSVLNNYFSINTAQKFFTDVLDAKETGMQPRLYNNEGKTDVDPFNTEDIKFISFNYSFETESKFKKEHFLFHGSPVHCWYPIMKNGLKVMSNTEFMTAGAAYGTGIYFSDSFNFSYGYAGGNRLVGTSKSDEKSFCVVGIFEINDDIEKYKRATNIYVINNDKVMLLRYLVMVRNKTMCNFQSITDYFFKYLGGINKFNERKITNITNKRLSAELKLLTSNSNVHDVNVINELTHWEINLKEINFRNKSSKIKLDVYFNNYPKLPPRITLNTELNLGKNTICDNSGNVILPELTLGNWEVTNNLSKIVDKIHGCVCSNISI